MSQISLIALNWPSKYYHTLFKLFHHCIIFSDSEEVLSSTENNTNNASQKAEQDKKNEAREPHHFTSNAEQVNNRVDRIVVSVIQKASYKLASTVTKGSQYTTTSSKVNVEIFGAASLLDGAAPWAAFPSSSSSSLALAALFRFPCHNRADGRDLYVLDAASYLLRIFEFECSSCSNNTHGRLQ